MSVMRTLLHYVLHIYYFFYQLKLMISLISNKRGMKREETVKYYVEKVGNKTELFIFM